MTEIYLQNRRIGYARVSTYGTSAGRTSITGRAGQDAEDHDDRGAP
jgi:hypothetical protein